MNDRQRSTYERDVADRLERGEIDVQQHNEELREIDRDYREMQRDREQDRRDREQGRGDYR